MEVEVVKGLEIDIEGVREYFRSGKTKEASWRRSQLKGLLKFLKEKEIDIFKALQQDLGKPHVEAYRDEIGPLIKSVNVALSCLSQWMSSRKAKLPIIAVLTTAELLPEPLGLVLITSSWNFPIGLSLEPLIGALAAGNTVVLKPSELSPACSSLLANVLPAYIDNNAVKVIQGNPIVCEQLLQYKWDKIFFTGGARVGRIVMSAAAKHLTPVTMELGGKCPAIVDLISNSFEGKAVIKRIVGGKFGSCGGQACIAIDYILVEKKDASRLVELLKSMLKEFFGEKPTECKDMTRIVNKQHFLRLKNLINDPEIQPSIVYGGSYNEDNLFIEPTILVDPPLDTRIMTDEIFGPLLPIITLEKIEHSIGFINSRPKPLSIYAFTKNEGFKRKIISETSSGSVTFNDTIIQYLAETLPFGGVGESGFGRYHGKFTFDTFSHEKAILRRSLLIDFWFRFPPWNDYKLQLFRYSYVFNYLGIVLVALRLKKPQHYSDIV